ncbi:hypothetical protein BT63DRAFT_394564 [Microthyrium microscopicum]|uniref:HECT-type E3 ubiquitin transferase n=1 Tax=Microthyrium microscopicum TaxID=703497 RepID=A0A6A6UP46_9PEZI|nr:hypothetical protein BT63DRAFT_394564 [Microthyrium microscopicum]
MHTTFSGSSRRPRQVNLSGRRGGNPFAPASSHGPPSALASAQQERERRQRERDRLNGAKVVQRYWRGYRSRASLSTKWRQEWDAIESQAGDRSQDRPYEQEGTAYGQVRLFLQFASLRSQQDQERLYKLLRRLSSSVNLDSGFASSGPWPMLYLRLQNLLLAGLDRTLDLKQPNRETEQLLFDSLAFTIDRISELTTRNAPQLYRTLARLIKQFSSSKGQSKVDPERLIHCTLVPLKSINARTTVMYASFAWHILTLEQLSKTPFAPRSLELLADGINYKLLANSLVEALSSTNPQKDEFTKDSRKMAFVLAYLIYFYRQAHRFNTSNMYSDDKDYMSSVSTLLSLVVAESVSKRSKRGHFEDDSEDFDLGLVENNSFVQEQVLSLVDSDSISSLLGNKSKEKPNDYSVSNGLDSDAKQLASFALTLMRFFPKKADDVRIALYRGSSTVFSANVDEKVPTIAYLWQAAKSTHIFQTICQNPDEVVPLLKAQTNRGYSTSSASAFRSSYTSEEIRDEWRIILVFFELYTFVLRLMDDEEFFSPAALTSSTSTSWASQNALPLQDVKTITVFLKNLGFSMYFDVLQLSEVEPHRERDPSVIGNYFSISARNQAESSTDEPKPQEPTVAGITGISMDYVKGIVTGLLRMLYERDSRRPFLPKGHWLMTSRLEMDGFISQVVQEDEKRHKIEEEDEDIGDPHSYEDEDSEDESQQLVGTSHSSNLRRQEKLRRQQRKYTRRKFLASVAPRLEILQNMPFFIPFQTRVEIFREFIRLDQLKRRGASDAETWGLIHSMQHPEMFRKHHARIQRNSIFEDAYEQFHPLAQGLKEPIQITFMDSFGNEEAGIDGGGVTKEFLTSITKEAFDTNEPYAMFVENEHHLLYPNPTAMEELKENPQRQAILAGDKPIATAASALLNRFEFLGRVVGKCLYEGILVDVSFASFFLLKWALTGGEGNAPKETSYRANLNDLRDMDEGLYQGLIKLKNYSGDTSDFGLDFTIVDTIITNYTTGKTKNITRDLKPDGANMAVDNQNRLLYIFCVVQHRLNRQPYSQTAAFLRGLSSMIKPSWLNMFNQSELQTLVGGTSSEIDVADLRRNTLYGGVYVIGDDGLEHPTIQYFWQVMEEMSDEERRAVLKFVTSTPRAPLLGFGSLMPRFSIRDSSSDQTRLPSTSTCVNLLKLPMYKTKAVLKEKLLLSVFSGAGFDLS